MNNPEKKMNNPEYFPVSTCRISYWISRNCFCLNWLKNSHSDCYFDLVFSMKKLPKMKKKYSFQRIHRSLEFQKVSITTQS